MQSDVTVGVCLNLLLTQILHYYIDKIILDIIKVGICQLLFDSLKRMATLMINMFYQEELYEP